MYQNKSAPRSPSRWVYINYSNSRDAWDQSQFKYYLKLLLHLTAITNKLNPCHITFTTSKTFQLSQLMIMIWYYLYFPMTLLCSRSARISPDSSPSRSQWRSVSKWASRCPRRSASRFPRRSARRSPGRSATTYPGRSAPRSPRRFPSRSPR